MLKSPRGKKKEKCSSTVWNTATRIGLRRGEALNTSALQQDVGQTRRSDGKQRHEREIDGGEIEHVLLAGKPSDGDMVRGKEELALAVALGLLGVFLAAMQQAAAFPAWTFEVRCEFVFRASSRHFTT